MGWREEHSFKENPLAIIIELLYPLPCTKKYVSKQPPPIIQYAALRLILSQVLWRHYWKAQDNEKNRFKKHRSPRNKLRLQLAVRIKNEISLSAAEIARHHLLWWFAVRAGLVLLGSGDGAGWWQGGDRVVRRVAKACSMFKHFQLWDFLFVPVSAG